MNYKCQECKADGAHYVSSDDLGFWHFFCDEHDPREFFQENRRLRAILEQVKDLLSDPDETQGGSALGIVLKELYASKEEK